MDEQRAAQPVERHQWDPLEKEPPRAYKAFNCYLSLGPTRSIDRAYSESGSGQKSRRSSGRWNDWSTRWQWTARAQAYDGYVADLARRAYEQAYEEKLVNLARMRAEEEFVFHEELLDECRRLREMMHTVEKTPLTDVEIDKSEEDLGRAVVTKTTTKIKGCKQLSGYSRMKVTWSDLRTKTVLGIRPPEKENVDRRETMPALIIQADDREGSAAAANPAADAGVPEPQPVPGAGSWPPLR